MAAPVGLEVGAAPGILAGAIRDFRVAGVDLDFVEEAENMLKPGKVAFVAEVDEEWVVPVDSALEASGGTVFRRACSEGVDQFDHDILALQGEIKEFEAETAKANATGVAESKLRAQVVAPEAGLARSMQHPEQRRPGA